MSNKSYTNQKIYQSDIKLPIEFVARTFPKQKDNSWARRSKKHIKKIIVHQAFESYQNTSFYDIALKHVTPGNHINPQGNPSIGYHYGVGPGGDMYCFNTVSQHITNTVEYEGISSLHILVLGDFDGPTYDGLDGHPTSEQLMSLERLLSYIIFEENKIPVKPWEVWGHSDYAKENCPGIFLDDFLQEWRDSFSRERTRYHQYMNQRRKYWRDLRYEKRNILKKHYFEYIKFTRMRLENRIVERKNKPDLKL